MLPVLMMGCARDHGGMELRIDGQAITIAPQSPLSDSEFVLFERAVEDGALQAETVVGEATSDAVGAFAVTFPRKSSYSLRWTAVAQDHFPAAGILDPEDLYPNEPFDLTVGLHAVCTLHVQLASIAPKTPQTMCASTSVKISPAIAARPIRILLEGVGADSAWQCLMHGDQWMTWGADLDVALIGQPDGLFVDSVFCPAFGSAELNLTW